MVFKFMDLVFLSGQCPMSSSLLGPAGYLARRKI